MQYTYNFAIDIKRREINKKNMQCLKLNKKYTKKEPVPCSTHTCLGTGERMVIYSNFLIRSISITRTFSCNDTLGHPLCP